VLDAILAHDGQARAARDAVTTLDPQSQEALIGFLNCLWPMRQRELEAENILTLSGFGHGLCGPKLIFGLLVSLVLPEHRRATVLDGPNVDLPRVPASAGTLRALRAQHDNAFGICENIIDLNAKRPAG
jgi:hypothetical protein